MLNDICRVCGRQLGLQKGLNLFDLVNKRYIKQLHMITGLRLEPYPNTPDFMCLRCKSDLRSALAFRRLCIKTQQKWIAIEKETSSSETESESKSELESVNFADSSTLLGNDDKRELKETFHIPNKEEPLELQETFQILIKEEPLDESLIREQEWQEKEDCIPKIEDQKIPITTQEPNPKDKIFICELCGTHATSKPSFQRHMRKHTGERPFCCKDCQARFLSPAELRAHYRVHTGEQPYGCRYCEKRYVSYMGRMKHERTHTNDRPFVCEECGKSYTDAYILKNHKLIHTGERPFKCDLCDRSFQRKTHLSAHFRSIVHHLNVESQESNAVNNNEDKISKACVL
ncbi:transcription factor Ouib [Drosophila ficusphila]|uniref:transcription factor Ouib n=1 Tax=Drosophila ficusphila TaxID=30025 RepID=UPI0007E5CA1D|nr:transcription factor Ouib [Drosophila ficusphila]